MLFMQTGVTSIELYWKDGMLRSRKGQGEAPPTRIPVVEDFAEYPFGCIRLEPANGPYYRGAPLIGLGPSWCVWYTL